MATDLHKYQTKELLNKVLNTGEDALKVDIDNATITAGDLEVNTDAMETKLDAMIVDLAAMEVDLAAMEVLLIAVKATTDKLDDCIIGSGASAKLSVDVKASVDVPTGE